MTANVPKSFLASGKMIPSFNQQTQRLRADYLNCTETHFLYHFSTSTSAANSHFSNPKVFQNDPPSQTLYKYQI